VIVIDQALITYHQFPRGQAWWDVFVPPWVTAVVCGPDGTFVALDTPDSTRRASLAPWIRQFGRLACAVIPAGEAPFTVTSRAVAARLALPNPYADRDDERSPEPRPDEPGRLTVSQPEDTQR